MSNSYSCFFTLYSSANNYNIASFAGIPIIPIQPTTFFSFPSFHIQLSQTTSTHFITHPFLFSFLAPSALIKSSIINIPSVSRMFTKNKLLHTICLHTMHTIYILLQHSPCISIHTRIRQYVLGFRIV